LMLVPERRLWSSVLTVIEAQDSISDTLSAYVHGRSTLNPGKVSQ
jgi:hypothetical protein